MAGKYIKRYSTALATGGEKSKFTMRYHFKLTRIAINKITDK